MQKGQHRDASDLAAALRQSEQVLSGKISVLPSHDDPAETPSESIHLRLHAVGDLDVIVAVVRPAILASVALCQTSEITRRDEFERGLLRAHKVMPLSTFAITVIDGVEYYEIFGQLSTGSELEEIVEEIETLGTNAIAAAEMIDSWKKDA